jgi:hypothetical protein
VGPATVFLNRDSGPNRFSVVATGESSIRSAMAPFTITG